MYEVDIGNYIYFQNIRLGKGSFSEVFKGFNKSTKKLVAIKKIDMSDKKMFIYSKRELEILKTLKNKNIVELYDSVTSTNPDELPTLYLILEYCENGDLSNFLNKKPLKEVYAQKYMRQFANGMKYLRNKNIVHRDLKPQNILIDKNYNLKITDFNFAKILDTNGSDLLQTICGSPLYMSPEIVKNKSYTVKADLWSIGMILYEMLIGKPPYKASNHYELIKKIDTQAIIIPNCISISDNCKDLLHGLLQKNVNKRIGWIEFFNHPWLESLTIPESDTGTQESMSPGTEDDLVSSKIICHDDYFNGEITGQSPSEKNGFILVGSDLHETSSFKKDSPDTRSIPQSLFSYMNQSVNYLKTYIYTLPNPQSGDYL